MHPLAASLKDRFSSASISCACIFTSRWKTSENIL
uniref:Uncharacterized protein n=1 Tax=Arundo donax TaxID=35708 RepID=A0A0A9F1U3_ARUDO